MAAGPTDATNTELSMPLFYGRGNAPIVVEVNTNFIVHA
jgi:hypothetical protein